MLFPLRIGFYYCGYYNYYKLWFEATALRLLLLLFAKIGGFLAIEGKKNGPFVLSFAVEYTFFVDWLCIYYGSCKDEWRAEELAVVKCIAEGG